jgi:hypothetical protein
VLYEMAFPVVDLDGVNMRGVSDFGSGFETVQGFNGYMGFLPSRLETRRSSVLRKASAFRASAEAR